MYGMRKLGVSFNTNKTNLRIEGREPEGGVLPNLREVVCWPFRYPQAEPQDSHGSGMPEQLPPNLGEKHEPFAHFVLLPSYHFASVVQESVCEHW